MRRLFAALAVLLSLGVAASAQPGHNQSRRQIEVGADWKTLFNGRMHYYLFGTIDRPLERRAFRVFRPDGTYRVQSIDGQQFTDGKWYYHAKGICQDAGSRAYCYDFERQSNGWSQRSNDGASFLVFIPDIVPADVPLPF
jgi:hypothetical protein